MPKSVGLFLVKQKFDVRLAKEVNPEMPDTQVLDLARLENRIIVSNDKDFISLLVKYSSVDMILFSYLNQSAEIRIEGLKKVLSRLEAGFGTVVLQ